MSANRRHQTIYKNNLGITRARKIEILINHTLWKRRNYIPSNPRSYKIKIKKTASSRRVELLNSLCVVARRYRATVNNILTMPECEHSHFRLTRLFPFDEIIYSTFDVRVNLSPGCSSYPCSN